MAGSRRYWPFPVIPAEQQTELDKLRIRFVTAAYDAGYEPYVDGLEWGASSPDVRRSGCIIDRGSPRRWWGEIVLWSATGEGDRAFVDDFGCAGDAVLRWLGGGSLSDIRQDIHPHVVSAGGSARRRPGAKGGT